MISSEIENALKEYQDFPKPGILFKDLSPVFRNPQLCKRVVKALAEPWRNKQLDGVVGIESRGFVLGLALALELDVPFILARKPGKLPGKVFAYEYELEYGKDKLEISADAIGNGNKLLIHDDILATGGTANAVYNLVGLADAETVGFSFIGEIPFLEGRSKLKSEVNSLIEL